MTLGNSNFASAFVALTAIATLGYLIKFAKGKLVKVLFLISYVTQIYIILKSDALQGLVTSLLGSGLFLGFLLLYRNIFKSQGQVNMVEITNPRFLTYLGFTGGFVDASGGGGWGPIVTPTLITTTATEPRKVVGTVSAAEFVVSLSASLGFLLQIWRIDIDWTIVGGLAIGGVIAAPIAARLVGKLPARQLGIVVALAIIVLNAVQIMRA